MLLQLTPASTFSDSTNNGTYSTEAGQVVYSAHGASEVHRQSSTVQLLTFRILSS